MRSALPLLPVGLLAISVACKPQSAELTSGAYAAFLSASNSRTVLEERIDITDVPVSYAIDCRNAPIEGADSAICEDDLFPPEHEAWADYDGFNVMAGDLEPWRGEGIITSEGDFQVIFHHRLPGGDFRFLFVIDPVFAPKECRTQPDTNTVGLQPIDGDWLAEWSNDLTELGEEGTLYYLNARSFQINPSNTSESWNLPQEWRAGFAAGKFGAEDLTLRSTRYGQPWAWDAAEDESGQEPDIDDLFFFQMQPGQDPRTSNGFQGKISEAKEVRDEIMAEFAMLSQGRLETLMGGEFAYEPRVHTNEWRVPDAVASGLDGWAELHYNWVRIDPGSDLTVGGSASGEFHLTFVANESPTRVMVRGTFSVPEIKRDRWAPRNVEAEKLAEAGVGFCGQPPPEPN